MSFLNVGELTEQQRQDMRDAYNACKDGIMPDWRHGFYHLALYALDNVSRRFTSELETIVNNWHSIDFADIFREMCDLVEDHPRAFVELWQTELANPEESDEEVYEQDVVNSSDEDDD